MIRSSAAARSAPSDEFELHGELQRREAVRFRSPIRRLVSDFEQSAACRLEVMGGESVMGARGGPEAVRARQRPVNVAPLDGEQVLLDRAGDQFMPDLERAAVGLDDEPVLDGLIHPGVQVGIQPISPPARMGRRSTRQPVRRSFELVGHRLERGPFNGLPDQRQEMHGALTLNGPDRKACGHEPAKGRPEGHPGEIAARGEDLFGQQGVPARALRGQKQQRCRGFLALDLRDELRQLITHHRPEFEPGRRIGRIGDCREIGEDTRVHAARIRGVGGKEADTIGAAHAGEEDREGPGGSIGHVHVLEHEQDRLELRRSLQDAEDRLGNPGRPPIRSDPEIRPSRPLRDQVGQQHPESVRAGPDDAPQLVLSKLPEEGPESQDHRGIRLERPARVGTPPEDHERFGESPDTQDALVDQPADSAPTRCGDQEARPMPFRGSLKGDRNLGQHAVTSNEARTRDLGRHPRHRATPDQRRSDTWRGRHR